MPDPVNAWPNGLAPIWSWFQYHRVWGCLLIVAVLALVALGVRMFQPNPLLQTWEIKDASAIASSPDGQVLAIPAGLLERHQIGNFGVSGYSTIELRHIGDGRVIRVLKVFPIKTVTFSPDGQLLASAGVDQIVRLYRISDGTLLQTLLGHTDAVRMVIFSPDGQLLASGGDDGVIRLWRVSDGTLVRSLEQTASVRSLAWRPDGQVLASSTAGEGVMLWQVSDGHRFRTLAESDPTGIAFSPDGQLLAVGTLYGAQHDPHGEVHLWQVSATEQHLERTLRANDLIYHLAFRPDGQLLAASGGSTDSDSPLGNWELWPPKRSILLWRVSDGRLIQTLRSPHREVNRLIFNADGQILISGGPDKDYTDIVCFWRVR
jgi:WD40 repeat protein